MLVDDLDDAYGVIFDEQDHDRSLKESSKNNTYSQNPPQSNTTYYCCGSLFIFALIGFILVILL